jgi:starch synthase
MRIAMVASECEPFAKTGGLADVVDSLSRALGKLGHAVDVYLPRYRGVEPPGPASELALHVPEGGGRSTDVRLLTAPADGYRLRLVDHAAYFDRPDYYVIDGVDYADNGARFALLGRTALEAMRAEHAPADVIHGHDWEGAPALLLLRQRYADDSVVGAAAALLTAHNLAYHGWVPRGVVQQQLDLPPSVGAADGVDLLREGLRSADLVNTVSPGFARESRIDGQGAGTEDVLRSLGDRYLGILNGLDTDLWDPATDAALPARYSAADLAGKQACRAALCEEVGLDAGGPLLGMVSRLDPQKGFDLVADAAPALVAAGARLCILGTGDHSLLARLREMAGRWPRRLAILDRFDRVLSRRIYAGADLFLMPSRFEPCGTSQMIAMRYGTLPVVRATGGLADTVVDADAEPERGTGFVFGPASGAALQAACQRAIDALADQPRFGALQQRAMAVDFSWAGPAAQYVSMYRRAATMRKGG